MSRMRKLKAEKNRSKSKFKAMMIGLSLMIIVGGAGVLGSYAYFSDKDTASNDLVIEMGSLHTVISPSGLKGSLELKDKGKNEISEQFKLENRGKLKQNIKVQLINGDSTSNLNNLEYELTVDKIKALKGNISELFTQDAKEVKDLVIESGKTVNCKATLRVKGDKKNLKELNGKKLDFKLDVQATQAN